METQDAIRVSKDGYTARPSEVDLVVALNPATYAKDVAALLPLLDQLLAPEAA